MYSQLTHVQHIHRFSPGRAARLCSARAPTRACAPRSKRGTAANPMLRRGRWYIPTRDSLQRRCCVGVPLPSSAPPPLAVGWAIYQPPAWGRPASRTRAPLVSHLSVPPYSPPPTLHARSLPPRPLFLRARSPRQRNDQRRVPVHLPWHTAPPLRHPLASPPPAPPPCPTGRRPCGRHAAPSRNG